MKDNLLDKIVSPLLEWYDKGRRVLPWREEPTPYHVWVSEIMLQQTRVEAVKPYYDRFMNALPTIADLAYAEEEPLLKLWEGLGYYNRIRNMKKAAVVIMEDHKGQMPAEFDLLVKLPGIGSYTAGAISSIAFGKPIPAVDGNVFRVLSRLRKDERDVMLSKTKKEIENELEEVMPADRPGDFNQALMELGAMVCTPGGTPKCEECPWNKLCVAHKDHCELAFPKKSPKKPRIVEDKTILVIKDEERFALHKRSSKGLLAGLYEFPTMEGHRTSDEVIEELKKQGFSSIRIQPLGESKHIFSHRQWNMIGYSVRVDELELLEKSADQNHYVFVQTATAQEEYPIPSAYAAYTKYLNVKLGIKEK